MAMTRARRELDIVTFRKAGLESTFSLEIFPPREREKMPEKSAAAENRLTREQISQLSAEYIPGTRVRHRSFGAGMLVSRSGDIAIVAFDSGEVKKLALSTALRAGQIEPAGDIKNGMEGL